MRKPDVTFDVQIQVPGLGDFVVPDIFNAIHDLIRDEVLPAFAGFFPEPVPMP
ncbi:MAG: hypothetical protein O2884_10585 [Chloroflexi bacterium]|nr:hypothetical protein [Chloroflexota bacterium]